MEGTRADAATEPGPTHLEVLRCETSMTPVQCQHKLTHHPEPSTRESRSSTGFDYHCPEGDHARTNRPSTARWHRLPSPSDRPNTARRGHDRWVGLGRLTFMG